MAKKTSSEIKVGIFFSVVLLGLLAAVLLLSSKSGMFSRTYRLETGFNNIAGLTVGAEVKLSGVQVGYVQQIQFAEDYTSSHVRIVFSVEQEALLRLSKDSTATIDTQGLLGKKHIALIPGDSRTGYVKEGDLITGVDPVSFTKELESAGEIIDNINALTASIRDVVASIQGTGTPTDLSLAITAIKKSVEGVSEGPGLAHTLIFNKDLPRIVTDLRGAAAELRTFITDARTGPGVLNALLYDPAGAKVVTSLVSAAGSLEEILAEIKEGEGTAHKIIYGAKGEDLIDELTLTARNLREVTDVIRAGEGTIGGLVMDPTIYEDIKKITGGVQRSQAMKRLINYTIHLYERRTEKEELDEN